MNEPILFYYSLLNEEVTGKYVKSNCNQDCDPSNRVTFRAVNLNTFEVINIVCGNRVISKIWLVPKTNMTCQGKKVTIPACKQSLSLNRVLFCSQCGGV